MNKIISRYFSFLSTLHTPIILIPIETPYGPNQLRVMNCVDNDFYYVESCWEASDYKNYYKNQPKYHMNLGKYSKHYDFLVSQLEFQGVLNKAIVDVGCGGGDFVKYLNGIGKNIKGINTYVNDKDAHLIKEGDVSSFDLYKNSDALMFVHVLEHVYDLDEFFNTLSKYKGKIYIETPNYSRCDMSSPFQEINLEHINLFTIPSLIRILTHYGFTIETIFETSRFDNYPLICCWIKSISSDSVKKYITDSQKQLSDLLHKTSDLPNDLIMYGCGQLAYKLLAYPEFANKISLIVDDNPSLHGKTIANKKIVGMTDFTHKNVLIGSILLLDDLRDKLPSCKIYSLL